MSLKKGVPPVVASSQVLPGHSESVASAKFSKDRTILATGDYSGIVSLWKSNEAPAASSTAADPNLPPPPFSPYKLDRYVELTLLCVVSRAIFFFFIFQTKRAILASFIDLIIVPLN